MITIQPTTYGEQKFLEELSDNSIKTNGYVKATPNNSKKPAITDNAEYFKKEFFSSLK